MMLTASIAGTFALVWLLLILLLHFIQPELDPAYSMCSEYARGRYGWLMRAAFLSMAAACLLFVFAAWPSFPHFGLILLVVVGLSFAGAGVFVTDPVLTTHEKATRSGNLHNLFAAIAILLFPVMAIMVSVAVPHWRIITFVVLGWIGCLGFIGAMVRTAQNKRVPFGYYQRFMIFALSGWLITAAFSMGCY